MRTSSTSKTKTLLPLGVALAALAGCPKSSSPPPSAPETLNFSGVWAGDAGPDPSALKFYAKIEIEDDAGIVSGEFLNEDPEHPGVYLRTGRIRGRREGGRLLLTAGSFIETPDAGRLEPQQLTLSYDGGFLVGARVLQLEGHPAVNEYLRLKKQ